MTDPHTLTIDREAYDQAHDDGRLGHDWRSCFWSRVAGVESKEQCITKGWPQWIVEAGVWIFDRYDDERAYTRGAELADALQVFLDRGGDWDRAFRDWRLGSILPIALEAVGEGDEPWRVDWREAVQWSIDNDGADNPQAFKAAHATDAAGATDATDAAEAAWVSVDDKAAKYQRKDVRDRIEQSLYRVLRGRE